ncbi:NFX1-type zinc finger-containing protein 1 isoform X5 [Gadus morhua]|uniref:NFX1-type zinc finger-containing protein 1-like n=1 Tax=Gadus morhua TaxID=8049 RepID=A0A8C4YVM3_GADMO|nr:NFX1-type zinc finger-containing protein 1-like isoform X5 [Gadus morhua]
MDGSAEYTEDGESKKKNYGRGGNSRFRGRRRASSECKIRVERGGGHSGVADGTAATGRAGPGEDRGGIGGRRGVGRGQRRPDVRERSITGSQVGRGHERGTCRGGGISGRGGDRSLGRTGDRERRGGDARSGRGGRRGGMAPGAGDFARHAARERSGSLTVPADQRDQSARGGRCASRGRGGDRGARPRAPQSRSAPPSDTRGGAPHGRRMTYTMLAELSEKPPSEVAITLSSSPAFQELLEERDIRHDLVQLVCSALSRAFQSRVDRRTVQHLAGVVKDSGFLRTILPQYVGGMSAESDPTRREQYPQHFDNLIAVLSKVLSIFPASSVQAVSVLVVLLRASLIGLRDSGVDIARPTEEKLEDIQALIQQLQERSREGSLRSDRDHLPLLSDQLDNEGEEELENFRTIPIYPTREEYHENKTPYLRPNATTGQYADTETYLDTHFRLLREDFVRPLREGIQRLICHLDQGKNTQQLKKERFDDISVYFDAKLESPLCTRSGIAYVIKFDVKPLKFVRWENSKKLLYGSLLCMSCDFFENFLFATISERELKDVKKGRIQVIFSDESKQKLATMQTNRPFLMVETSAYFEAYRHVLEGLQEVRGDELPFQRYIVECSPDVQPPRYLRGNDMYNLEQVADPKKKKKIKPFHCLRPADWPAKETLDLDESQMEAFQLALTQELAIIQGPPGTGKTHVGLKIAKALLTNQGLWSAHQEAAPMLVVCYTNHALDQFLEGIHTFLKKGIVRVGGRSNSTILEPFLLKHQLEIFRRGNGMPKHLRYAFKDILRDMVKWEHIIKDHAVQLQCSQKGVLREHILQKFISDRHWHSLEQPAMPIPEWYQVQSQMVEWLGLGPTIIQQEAEKEAHEDMETDDHTEAEVVADEFIQIIEEADLIHAERFIEDGFESNGEQEEQQGEELILAVNFEKVSIQEGQSEQEWQIQAKQRKRIKLTIQKELDKESDMTEAEEKAIFDIWHLSMADRWRLYRLWVSRYRYFLQDQLQQSEEEYQNTVERLEEVRLNEKICLLRSAKVIGMTTTGAAKFRKILQEVRPRLVIVEEAAEVLEAHTITSLNPECQHLILIGDHQQLRPSATVYDLAKRYDLEVSMFERLVKNDFPFVRLNYQHRMRPDIACLLTPHIYPELENHPSVMDYDNVKGIKTNLFFLEHSHLEENLRDGKSHENKHEAMFVVALCRYLLMQDYNPEQITILTTYSGQLFCLRNMMPSSEFAGVKVHVVDKYQGEENDIVLLSLVRSNAKGIVGFLSIPNRVCVALSRAKKGLYCIGNSAILSKVKLWSNIFGTLKEKEQMGKALTLCCQNHPEKQIQAACSEDFKQAPEGGCLTPCEFRLDCGHVCERVCHPYDPQHKKYKCEKNCERKLCDRGHKCPLACHRQCPACPVKIEKTLPGCGHKQMVPCYMDPADFKCIAPCEKSLQCGHQCKAKCGGPCTINCKVMVPFILECGHTQSDYCFYKTKEYEPNCRTPCDLQLKCGHSCTGTCYECNQGRYHLPCSYQCERLLICSHKCREPCTGECPPCKLPCENVCIHSKCKKRCGQPCAPCAEPCAWQCLHQSCSKLCHEPCDRPPCTKPCSKMLGCGHPCIGLCGDKCPNKCRVCDHDEVTEIFFGSEDDPEAYFIQLEDCGHIVESEAMDTYMEMDQKSEDNEQMVIKLKECPRCRTPIRRNLRYGSHINRSLAEIEKVKEKITGHKIDIETESNTLTVQWETNRQLLTHLPDICNERVQSQLSASHITANELVVVEHTMLFMERAAMLLKIQKEEMTGNHSLRFTDKVDVFLQWLLHPKQKFTEQQVSDLQKELQRLTLLAELNARCTMADQRQQITKIQAGVDDIRKVLDKIDPFTEQDADKVKLALLNLDEKLPYTGLGISDKEREMVVSALKLPPGHWYKCPNGHIYIITECGGAMESRRCPDCDATIGGQSHALASGNQVASEMDGAQHAAWSEGNNLLNYGQIDFND